MANGAYKYGMAEIWRGNTDFLADNIKAVYVNVSGTGTLYSVNLSTHKFLSDIAAGARIATSPNLAGKTISDLAVIDCNDFTLTSVPNDGNDYEVLVFYKDTGVEATSTLLFYIDTGTNMQQTPDGGNIDVTINAGGLAVAA